MLEISNYGYRTVRDFERQLTSKGHDMLRVEVQTAGFETKSGVSTRTGKSYTIREQEGYLYSLDKDGKQRPHPERITIPLDDGQHPYPPGNYQVCPTSLYVGRFGLVGIRLKLRPLQAAPARAA